jgi:hypothetical protein
MEWDPDNASSSCVICEKSWGTFRNRRHHCRHCGRLVCEACSKKKLILGEKEVFQFSNFNNKTQTSFERSNSLYPDEPIKQMDDFSSKRTGGEVTKSSGLASKPKRVCDACYKLLTKKSEVKLEISMKREREQALLQASSHVRPSYFLFYYVCVSYSSAIAGI